jgi:hypothetical protein
VVTAGAVMRLTVRQKLADGDGRGSHEADSKAKDS